MSRNKLTSSRSSARVGDQLGRASANRASMASNGSDGERGEPLVTPIC
jgi:hypothetical protein